MAQEPAQVDAISRATSRNRSSSLKIPDGTLFSRGESSKKRREVSPNPRTPPPLNLDQTRSGSSPDITDGAVIYKSEERSIRRSRGSANLALPLSAHVLASTVQVLTDARAHSLDPDALAAASTRARILYAAPLSDAAFFLGGDLALASIFGRLRALQGAVKATWAQLREASTALNEALSPLCERLEHYELHREVLVASALELIPFRARPSSCHSSTSSTRPRSSLMEKRIGSIVSLRRLSPT